MNNAISFIKEDFEKHEVTLVLPREEEKRTLFLIELKTKTNTLQDFLSTYRDQITPLRERMARDLFDDSLEENIYGLLVDEELKLVFAFNRRFADIDKENNVLVFKDIDELLLRKIVVPKIPKHPSTQRKGTFRDFDKDPRNIVVKYSLTEKV